MSEGGVNKIIAIVLAVVVLVLVTYGITTKGFGPIRENAAEKFNEIQLLFGDIKDGTASDNCRDREIGLEDDEIEGILNVCENVCSYELIAPSDLLNYEEFSLDDGGYDARMVGSEDFVSRDAFGSNPDVSDLHRDAYLVLKEVVDGFSTDYGNNFLELLGTDFDRRFMITFGDEDTFTWNGEIWRKGLSGVELYSEEGDKYETISGPLNEEDSTLEGVWSEFQKDVDFNDIKEFIPELDIKINRYTMRIEIEHPTYGNPSKLSNAEFYLNEDKTEILTKISVSLGSRELSLEEVSDLNADYYRYVKMVASQLKENLDKYNSENNPNEVTPFEGVWVRFEDYVNDRKDEEYKISINKGTMNIKFESSKETWGYDKAEFHLDEDRGQLLIDITGGGALNHPVKDLDELWWVNEEVREIAKGLSAVFDDYILSLGDSDEDVFSEIYDEYKNKNSNVYWNYVGDGTAKELTFNTDVSFMDGCKGPIIDDGCRSEKEIKEWMDKIAEDVDFMGDDYSVTIKIKGATRDYLYKNNAWHKSGFFGGSSLDEGVVLEALSGAKWDKKIITLIYEKVEKEKFDGWLDEKTKISEYTKEQQDDLFLELSNYLEGATVNFRGKDFPIIIKRNEESNRIIIYFEDDDGNRFGVYSDEKNLVLTYGDEKSIVSDWVSLGDADWVKFLKINKINKYISYRCPV